MDKVINYVKNGEKTEKGILVSGVNCNNDLAYMQMIKVKKAFNKEDGIEEALKRRKPNRYGLIFIRNNGKLFEDGQINSAFKRICKNAGLRLIQQKHKKTTASKGVHYVNYMSSDVNTHMLRHTFATRCIEAGVRIEVLQKLLGHSDIQTTINTYGKIYDYLSQSALSKYSNYMNETNEKFDKEFNKLEENMEKETNISYNK